MPHTTPSPLKLGTKSTRSPTTTASPRIETPAPAEPSPSTTPTPAATEQDFPPKVTEFLVHSYLQQRRKIAKLQNDVVQHRAAEQLLHEEVTRLRAEVSVEKRRSEWLLEGMDYWEERWVLARRALEAKDGVLRALTS